MGTDTIIVEKFQYMHKCLRRIEGKLEGDPSRLDDPDVQDIFALNLQRAAQCCIDAAARIIAIKGLTIPNTMKGYFELLGSEGIVSSSLTKTMAKNIAVHDYQNLDPEILKSIYSGHLGDFERYEKEILSSLQRAC